MLWFCCLPHLTGHKMSGNYIRVIPPVSTFVGKFLRPRSRIPWSGGSPSRKSLDRARRAGRSSVSLLGELQRGRQVGGPEGHSKEASCQRSRQNVAPPSVVRAAALYPTGTLGSRPCGPIEEQPCEFRVDFPGGSPQNPQVGTSGRTP